MAGEPFEEAMRRMLEAIGRHRGPIEQVLARIQAAMDRHGIEIERGRLANGARTIHARAIARSMQSTMRAKGLKRRGPRDGKDRDLGGVVVDPTRPRDMSGGAAAALDFDEV